MVHQKRQHKYMGLLDIENLDKELDKCKQIKESLNNFKHSKIIRNKKQKETRKGYFERKQKIKSNKKFNKKYNKGIVWKKYTRCPQKYDRYIKSTFWEDRRKRYFRDFGKICIICGSTKFIVLHHAVYGNFGNEKDEHLFSMCSKHHEEYHILNGTQGNMLEKTQEFIKSYPQF